MFARLAVLLVLAVALTMFACVVWLRVVLPERRRQHVRDMEQENERLDNIINSRRGR